MKRLWIMLCFISIAILLGGCKAKEKTFSEFSAIGRINVVQDVDESTKATLRLFTTKKYNKIKVNKIDSPDTYEATVSEPKMVVVRKGDQKRNSYYYTITITFNGPAQFSKVELSLDDKVKTYNIGHFECKEIDKTSYEIGDELQVRFDVPFENYQQVYASDAVVPIRLTNLGTSDIIITSIKSNLSASEYTLSILNQNLHNKVIKSNEALEASTLYFGVRTDDLMQLETLIEIIYQYENEPHILIASCSLGLVEEVLESEILPTVVELDQLNDGKVCTLEEDLENS